MKRHFARKCVAAALLMPLLFIGGTAGAFAATHRTKGQTVFPGTLTMSFPNVNSTQFLVLDYAQASGILAKYGITANIEVVSAATITAALESGAIQIAIGAAPGVELAFQEGVPVKLIGSYGEHIQGEFIGRPGITKIQSLEGHSSGSSSLTALSTILPKYALVLNHVPLSTVTFVPTGANPSGEFIAGQFDALDASIGEAIQIQQALPGTSDLYNFHGLSWPSGNIWAYTPWLTSHKAEAVAVLKAINASIDSWESNSALADQTIAKVQALTSQSSIAGAYSSTIAEMNRGPIAVHEPTTHLEQFVNKVLRLVGFPTAYNSYAKEGQEWTPSIWNAAFGKS